MRSDSFMGFDLGIDSSILTQQTDLTGEYGSSFPLSPVASEPKPTLSGSSNDSESAPSESSDLTGDFGSLAQFTTPSIGSLTPPLDEEKLTASHEPSQQPKVSASTSQKPSKKRAREDSDDDYVPVYPDTRPRSKRLKTSGNKPLPTKESKQQLNSSSARMTQQLKNNYNRKKTEALVAKLKFENANLKGQLAGVLPLSFKLIELFNKIKPYYFTKDQFELFKALPESNSIKKEIKKCLREYNELDIPERLQQNYINALRIFSMMLDTTERQQEYFGITGFEVPQCEMWRFSCFQSNNSSSSSNSDILMESSSTQRMCL